MMDAQPQPYRYILSSAQNNLWTNYPCQNDSPVSSVKSKTPAATSAMFPSVYAPEADSQSLTVNNNSSRSVLMRVLLCVVRQLMLLSLRSVWKRTSDQTRYVYILVVSRQLAPAGTASDSFKWIHSDPDHLMINIRHKTQVLFFGGGLKRQYAYRLPLSLALLSLPRPLSHFCCRLSRVPAT